MQVCVAHASMSIDTTTANSLMFTDVSIVYNGEHEFVHHTDVAKEAGGHHDTIAHPLFGHTKDSGGGCSWVLQHGARGRFFCANRSLP